MYKPERKTLSQNFLHNQGLIASLVHRSLITADDVVIEIGSGKGSITEQLLGVAKKVIAIELDSNLVATLSKRIADNPNLEIHQADFLLFSLPKTPYKVFANIPFAIEKEILRKLLSDDNPPQDSYLVVDKRLALSLSGKPHENQFSLLHKPWFDFAVYHHFKRSDFAPIPDVEAVMLHMHQKEAPLLPVTAKRNWYAFVAMGFNQGRPLYANLRKILSKEQLTQISNKISLSLKTKPSYVSLEQWIRLYSSLYA